MTETGKSTPLEAVDGPPFSSRQEAIAYVKRHLAAELSTRIRAAKSGAEIGEALKEFREKWDGVKLSVQVRTEELPKVHLEFDGAALYWVQDGKRGHAWQAVSGAPGRMSRQFQTAFPGPLPEGEWIVLQSNYQQISDNALVHLSTEWTRKTFFPDKKAGMWMGGERSWGPERIWLEPAEGTNTWDRDGFSIHGGAIPGSAGCIDLTSDISSFTARFLAHGEDLRLIVRY